jgi:hypothetical protein
VVAQWVATCDQSAVDEPEFRALLQYTHHPSNGRLDIPHAHSVKARIMNMGDEMTDGLRLLLKVGLLTI